jgi:hypothetical protein
VPELMQMPMRDLSLRADRKSKVQPSQLDRRKKRPKKKPGDCYTVTSFARGIAQAIKRHNRKPALLHVFTWTE